MITQRPKVSSKRKKHTKAKFLKAVIDKPRMTLIDLDKIFTDILE